MMRENFCRTMLVSCYSFTEVSRLGAEMMPDGGSIITLTYAGSVRVMPNYNVMGVAKASLEMSVRYLAADLGPRAIRVNAISAGPVNTLSARGVRGFTDILGLHRERAPLKRNVHLDEVGGAGLYLLSDLSGAVTGEVHHVDCGYHAVGMPAQPSPETPGKEAGKPGN